MRFFSTVSGYAAHHRLLDSRSAPERRSNSQSWRGQAGGSHHWQCWQVPARGCGVSGRLRAPRIEVRSNAYSVPGFSVAVELPKLVEMCVEASLLGKTATVFIGTIPY